MLVAHHPGCYPGWRGAPTVQYAAPTGRAAQCATSPCFVKSTHASWRASRPPKTWRPPALSSGLVQCLSFTRDATSPSSDLLISLCLRRWRRKLLWAMQAWQFSTLCAGMCCGRAPKIELKRSWGSKADFCPEHLEAHISWLHNFPTLTNFIQ